MPVNEGPDGRPVTSDYFAAEDEADREQRRGLTAERHFLVPEGLLERLKQASLGCLSEKERRELEDLLLPSPAPEGETVEVPRWMVEGLLLRGDLACSWCGGTGRPRAGDPGIRSDPSDPYDDSSLVLCSECCGDGSANEGDRGAQEAVLRASLSRPSPAPETCPECEAPAMHRVNLPTLICRACGHEEPDHE